jgi:hypothetical protein
MAWVLVAAGLTYVGAAAITGPDRQTPAQFAAYATGTALHVSALQTGGTRVLDVDDAFSGAVAYSNGLPTCNTDTGAGCIQNEFNVIVQPTLDDTPVVGKRTSGRGSGLELNLGGSAPVSPAARAAAITGIAEATAPPDSPLVEQSTAIPVDPLIYAGLLTGQAQAKYSDLLDRCPTDVPNDFFSFGRGFAADAQLINGGAANPDGSMSAPIVSTNARLNPDGTINTSPANGPNPGTVNNTTFTTSRVVPVDNGDGTFGLRAIIESSAVPIRVNLPPDNLEANDIIIVVGKASMILTATGKAGDPRNGIQYLPAPSPNIVIPAILPGDVTAIVPLPIGHVNVPGLLDLAVAEDPPHAIGNPNNPAISTPTSVSAAVDAVRITIPDQIGPLPIPDPQLLDLRVQHFEGSLQVPDGGFSFNDCGRIRITKSVIGNLTGAFGFHVDCPGTNLDASESDFTLVNGASKIIPVPSGTECTVTETNNRGASLVRGTITPPGGTPTATAMPAKVTAPTGFRITDLNVTNLNVGNLRVAKVSQAGLNGPFGFTADCRDTNGVRLPDGTGSGQVLRSFNLSPNESKTFTDLPGGTNCTVAEANPGGASVTRISDSTGPNNSDGIVHINGGDLQTVTFSNAGPPLVITKLATGESAGKGPFDFHLTCTDSSGATVALDATDADFTLKSGEEHVLARDIPDDSVCKVTEVDSAKATSVVATDTDGAGNDATIVIHHLTTQVVAFTNNFAPQIKLIVAKKVNGTGKGPFTFHVACVVGPNSAAIPLAAGDADFTLADGQSHSIKSLPDGSKCTVTETDAKGAAVAFADSTAPVNDGVVSIPVDGAASVTSTNTFVATATTVRPSVVQPRTVG